ncbi:lysis protein [Pseudomonas marginalis]|uniref:Lysis protein n=1 Tax=Pseudomonas marginalis TaxID=298 RepID=A0A9X9BRL2_PSEMA|nr:lysis system i-spanin subunit Rz [Pseudomonas marginalis]TWR59347.1 lysis protein [Pseudomonas marginalis]SEC73451.1 Bacteriophage Rz lysis protein [Pseudomonas marginalis]
MTPVQKLVGLGLAFVLALAIGFGGAWQFQDGRLGKKMAERIAEQAASHQKELDAITGEAWRQQTAELNKRLATEQQLAKQDQQHTKELSDAKTNQARLRDRLATSDLRLSVLLAEDSAGSCNVPTAAGAGGVVHAAGRAQLDRAHAQRIIDITDAGDQGLIALRACQAYAKEVSTPK